MGTQTPTAIDQRRYKPQNREPLITSGEKHTGRAWFAVFTLPQNERSVIRHLDSRQIESFLPTCEVTRVWKNRQRVKIVQPLFPTYVFVHIDSTERTRVLQSPGVLHIVGNSRGPVPVSGPEIELLRSDSFRSRLEPWRDIVIGQRVRIVRGPFCGVEGILVRRKDSCRFVLTLELINQHAAVEVSADDLQPLTAA